KRDWSSDVCSSDLSHTVLTTRAQSYCQSRIREFFRQTKHHVSKGYPTGGMSRNGFGTLTRSLVQTTSSPSVSTTTINSALSSLGIVDIWSCIPNQETILLLPGSIAMGQLSTTPRIGCTRVQKLKHATSQEYSIRSH